MAQRGPVADELSKAAQETLESDASSISNDVREKAKKMVCSNQWNPLLKHALIHSAVLRPVVRARRGE